MSVSTFKRKKVMYDVAIVGGGFRGLITAYLALKKGLTVVLIDSSPNLGGF